MTGWFSLLPTPEISRLCRLSVSLPYTFPPTITPTSDSVVGWPSNGWRKNTIILKRRTLVPPLQNDRITIILLFLLKHFFFTHSFKTYNAHGEGVPRTLQNSSIPGTGCVSKAFHME
jgi:hypothetical protein